MCVSMAPAEFSGTILYCGRRCHPQHGWIEVLGYQNAAVNLATGPNAMLLHLSAKSVSSRQFLRVGSADRVLHSMVDAVRPIPAGPTLGTRGPIAIAAAPRVEIFQHDIYTVVLAHNAAHIPDALERVEPRKRPALNRDLFDFYADLYPGQPIVLCCFDNKDAADAKPLMLWYEPRDEDRLVLPAIDCHTGAIPDLDSNVLTDHWLLFGSDRADWLWGEKVHYGRKPSPKLLEYLPPRVMGWHFDETMPNGDFAIAHDDLLRGEPTAIERVSPL
ncbi:hypothetical protein KDK95_14910 [Actinospica sp. MGRD01-02]|uniref:Uncharacterized protein n=1 Tax=Actinospica acidithermotolerans TaxID=2828514 RepID=A0A941ILG5_9ACTN|nr:hypothetical protein [Actinospica acidithermotolerans]MBR7827606.1 hypothetical protein [Actinospica acidithermotolerans]